MNCSWNNFPCSGHVQTQFCLHAIALSGTQLHIHMSLECAFLYCKSKLSFTSISQFPKHRMDRAICIQNCSTKQSLKPSIVRIQIVKICSGDWNTLYDLGNWPLACTFFKLVWQFLTLSNKRVFMIHIWKITLAIFNTFVLLKVRLLFAYYSHFHNL